MFQIKQNQNDIIRCNAKDLVSNFEYLYKGYMEIA